jgi:hypothetical protein
MNQHTKRAGTGMSKIARLYRLQGLNLRRRAMSAAAIQAELKIWAV